MSIKNDEEKTTYFVPVLVLVALGFLVWSNTFHSSFHFDDQLVIVKNHSIRNLSDFNAIWKYFNTRFFVGLTLALNYSISQLNVFGYHLFNTIIHILGSIFVYALILLTFETPLASGENIPRSTKNTMAFLGALIFLTHPIQTQAVTYIWQRTASMATLFYLAALVFYVQWRLKHSKSSLFISLVCTALSMFTKEIAFTLPFVITFYEFFCFKNKDGNKWKRWVGSLPYLLITFFAISLTLTQAHHVTSTLMKPQTAEVTRFVDEKFMSSHNYWLTQIPVLRTYIRLLFIPLNQNIDYAYPPSRAFFEPRTLTSFIFLSLVMALGILMRNKNKLISLGIFWFFVTLSVESFVIQQDVIFEHRLYLPSVGYVFFLTGIMLYAYRKSLFKPMTMVLGLLIVVNAFLAYQRNAVWKDELSLWDDAVKKSPKKARVYLGRGNAYRDKKQFDLALADYNRAAEVNPYNPWVLTARGTLLKDQGLLNEALSDFNKAVGLKGDYAGAYMNRGAVYAQLGKLKQAIEDYDRALEINPDNAQLFYDRANAYQRFGLFEDALKDYDRAIEIDSRTPEFFNNRAVTYFLNKQYKESWADVQKVLGLGYAVKKDFYEALQKVLENG